MKTSHHPKFKSRFFFVKPAMLALLLAVAVPQARADQLFRLYMQGRNAYNARDYAKAVESWSAVLAIDPKDITALTNRALAYRDMKEWDKAAADATAIIALTPDDPGAYQFRGDIYHTQQVSRGYAPAATEYARKAVDDYTKAVKMRSAKEAAPEQWLRHGGAYAVNDNQELVVASCSAILQFAPNDEKVLFGRGDEYIRLALYDEAIADFDAVLKLDPNNGPALDERLRARGQKVATSPKLLPETMAKEIDDLSEIIRRRPVSGSYVGRGEVYERAGDYDKAMADYQQALTLSGGKDNGAHEGMADIYAAQGDWKKAIESYNHIIDTNDYGDLVNHADIYDFRAMLYLNEGEYGKAIADVNKCMEGEVESLKESRKENKANDWGADDIKFDEKWSRESMARYYAERGAAWLRAGSYAKALEDFNNAFAEDAAATMGPNGRAWLLATCADPKFRDGPKAVVLATKVCALGLWAKAGDIDTLAAAYAESGKWDQAVVYERLAIKAARDDGKMPDRSAAAEKQQADLVKSYQAREALYAQKKPFRGNKNLSDWEE